MVTKKAPPAPNTKTVVDEEKKKKDAKVQWSPAIAGCAASEVSMKASYGVDYDFTESVYALREQIKEVQSGDMSGVEAMLVGQAHALQQVFVALMRKAGSQEYLKQYQTHMNLGLKAQAQCRATIQALTELKYPRQVVITKQANIANGPQQVNNGNGQNAAPAPAPVTENAIEQNELLEVNDGSSTMDVSAAPRTSRKSPAMAAVGALDRS